MSPKARLHELIEQMNDDQAAVLLMELDLPYPPLTAEDIASIERGRADSRAGRTTPHEEVMHRFGLTD